MLHIAIAPALHVACVARKSSRRVTGPCLLVATDSASLGPAGVGGGCRALGPGHTQHRGRAATKVPAQSKGSASCQLCVHVGWQA